MFRLATSVILQGLESDGPLCLGHCADHTFNSTFLMTYRSFVSGKEVVERLAKRYDLQAPAGLTPDQLRDWQDRKQKPVKLRVFNVFKTWLDQHWNEEEDAEVLDMIEGFANEVLTRDNQLKTPYPVLIRAAQRRVSRGLEWLRGGGPGDTEYMTCFSSSAESGKRTAPTNDGDERCSASIHCAQVQCVSWPSAHRHSTRRACSSNGLV